MSYDKKQSLDPATKYFRATIALCVTLFNKGVSEQELVQIIVNSKGMDEEEAILFVNSAIAADYDDDDIVTVNYNDYDDYVDDPLDFINDLDEKVDIEDWDEIADESEIIDSDEDL